MRLTNVRTTGTEAADGCSSPRKVVEGEVADGLVGPSVDGGPGPGSAPDVVSAPVPDLPSTTFSDVYESNFDDLVRLAGMISGSTAVAEDVVQDAFARLYLRFDSIEHPQAYLRRSVMNGCVSRFRKHRRERLVHDDADGPDGSAEPSERLDLERRLATLSDRQRAVVVLRIHLGLPESEVAETLNCRPGTVGSLLHRALNHLRIDLQEHQP